MSKHYDFIVIGSGGGAKISSPASRLGYKVALVEKGALGGTCLNRGCIPSKMLIHTADIVSTFKDAPRHQIHPEGHSVDFQTLVERVSQTIDEESASIQPNLEANPNLDWYPVHGRFVDDQTLQVGDEQITADRIVIATGARPFIPNIPGLSDTPFLTSTEALRLTKQPKSMIVLGGGYIATELAYYFGGLGTQIHMLARSGLLRHEDSEVAREFTRVFSSRFDVHQDTHLQQVSYENGQFTLNFQNHQKQAQVLHAEQLLVATGVVPNTDALGLENTSVQLDDKGFIVTNDHLETNSPHIWALGDVVGNFLFRHSANYEGEYLLEQLAYTDSEKRPIDYTAMPHAVFSYPQVAGVGCTEEELQSSQKDYVVGVNKYAQSAMGMALQSDHGFVKFLVEKKTRKLLGCHIVGHEASTLIHEVLPLFRLGLKLDDVLNTIHIHPALSELVRNAARKARNALVESGEALPLWLQLK